MCFTFKWFDLLSSLSWRHQQIQTLERRKQSRPGGEGGTPTGFLSRKTVIKYNSAASHKPSQVTEAPPLQQLQTVCQKRTRKLAIDSRAPLVAAIWGLLSYFILRTKPRRQIREMRFFRVARNSGQRTCLVYLNNSRKSEVFFPSPLRPYLPWLSTLA